MILFKFFTLNFVLSVFRMCVCVCVHVCVCLLYRLWVNVTTQSFACSSFHKTGSEEPRKQMCDACLVLPAAMFPPSGGKHPGWESWSKFRQPQASLSPIWSSLQIFNGVINLQKAKLQRKHLFSLKRKERKEKNQKCLNEIKKMTFQIINITAKV